MIKHIFINFKQVSGWKTHALATISLQFISYTNQVLNFDPWPKTSPWPNPQPNLTPTCIPNLNPTVTEAWFRWPGSYLLIDWCYVRTVTMKNPFWPLPTAGSGHRMKRAGQSSSKPRFLIPLASFLGLYWWGNNNNDRFYITLNRAVNPPAFGESLTPPRSFYRHPKSS